MSRKKSREVEAEGFYHGSQGVEPDAALNEINAQFDQEKEKVHHNAADRIKNLEATKENLERRKDDAEKHWRALEADTNRMPPFIAFPLIAVLLAGLAVMGEVILLAPVMDGFGIADPMLQYLTAAVLVLVSSGLLEMTIRQSRAPHKSNPKAENEQGARVEKSQLRNAFGVMLIGALTVLAFMLVVVLGWWRAEEMIFAASIEQGEWGSFLGQNPALTRVCVILLTIGLPVFAAIAFEWGFDSLRLAWEWRKARRAFMKTSRQLADVTKKLEAEKEKRDRTIAALDKENEEWVNAYLENYELGQKIGAQRQPLWQVIVKIVAVALVILLACLLLDSWLSEYVSSDMTRILIYALAMLGLGGLDAYYAIKSWDRPTPRQLSKHRAIIWRNSGKPNGQKAQRIPDEPRQRVEILEARPVTSRDNDRVYKSQGA